MFKAVLPEWSSMLMVGSPGIGMLEFTVSLAKSCIDTNEIIIFVTVDLLPKDLLTSMEAFGISPDTLGKNLYIIDYHSSLLGSMDGQGDEQAGAVRHVADLEGIMFNISEIANEAKRPVKVFIHSLSTLFLYNQTNVVIKFFQISSSRIRTEMGTIIFTLHEGVHDEKTVNHLMAIADGVLELKFDDHLNRQIRIRHMRGYVAPSQWIPFEIRQVKTNPNPSVLQWSEG